LSAAYETALLDRCDLFRLIYFERQNERDFDEDFIWADQGVMETEKEEPERQIEEA
jgi:hypothetical protein